MMSSQGPPSKRAEARRVNPSFHDVIKLFSESLTRSSGSRDPTHAKNPARLAARGREERETKTAAIRT